MQTDIQIHKIRTFWNLSCNAKSNRLFSMFLTCKYGSTQIWEIELNISKYGPTRNMVCVGAEAPGAVGAGATLFRRIPCLVLSPERTLLFWLYNTVNAANLLQLSAVLSLKAAAVTDLCYSNYSLLVTAVSCPVLMGSSCPLPRLEHFPVTLPPEPLSHQFYLPAKQVD